MNTGPRALWFEHEDLEKILLTPCAPCSIDPEYISF
jgi:hypothetical protein